MTIPLINPHESLKKPKKGKRNVCQTSKPLKVRTFLFETHYSHFFRKTITSPPSTLAPARFFHASFRPLNFPLLLQIPSPQSPPKPSGRPRATSSCLHLYSALLCPLQHQHTLHRLSLKVLMKLMSTMALKVKLIVRRWKRKT